MVMGRVLVPGTGDGRLLRLRAPISLWGGVDPVAGKIIDPRHPDFGVSIRGTVLSIPGAVGSSSSSAIMLELLRERTAPAAVLMAHADAILALGVVVGQELGYETCPVLEVDPEALRAFPDGTHLHVSADGSVTAAPQ